MYFLYYIFFFLTTYTLSGFHVTPPNFPLSLPLHYFAISFPGKL